MTDKIKNTSEAPTKKKVSNPKVLLKSNLKEIRESLHLNRSALSDICLQFSGKVIHPRSIAIAEEDGNVTVEVALIIYYTLKSLDACNHFHEVFYLADPKTGQKKYLT